MDNCRYIKCGICTINGEICNDCGKQFSTIKYTYSYNPFAGTTRISIISHKGKPYITCEIYGQLPPVTIKAYAIDLCKMLMDKGVIT